MPETAAWKPPARLDYIDWMRGLACVVMFQAHGYDSWLTPQARNSWVYLWSQRFATIPAPIFLFLCGVSFVLLTERLREKGIGRDQIARTTIRRGAEIYVLGILFRIQEFVLGIPKSHWTDLLRVDILNVLGISMMLMGIFSWLVAGRNAVFTDAKSADAIRKRAAAVGLITASAMALATPLLWTVARPAAMGWAIESYVNGVHTFGVPQPWLFPLFPWAAFAFVGFAIGSFLCSTFSKTSEIAAFLGLGVLGVACCLLSVLLDSAPVKLYPVYDYWHTSPNFFLLRCGLLLIILAATYAWCRWGMARKGFSIFLQLGTTSLLVYWVHVEFVYGRLSILRKNRSGISLATLGIFVILAAMTGLSLWWTRYKKARRAATRKSIASGAPLGAESPTAM